MAWLEWLRPDALKVFVEITDDGVTCDVASCMAGSFYIEANTIRLCPEACSAVQADTGARLDVLYGQLSLPSRPGSLTGAAGVGEHARVIRFARRAPLHMTPLPPPPPEVRTGTSLTQGFLFTLFSTVAATELREETLAALRAVDPEAWYDGQHLETMLSELEDRDPKLPWTIGRSVYFMLRPEIERAAGITSADALIVNMPQIWQVVTRGDRGEFRTALLGPGRARVELEQPYNCRFEEGALHGLLESYEARDVTIAHAPCMRDGAPCCVLDVRWSA